MMIIGVLGGYIPYLLSLLNRDPVIEVGVTWITSVTAVCLGYFVRGFKDSQAEAEADLEFNKWEHWKEAHNDKLSQNGE